MRRLLQRQISGFGHGLLVAVFVLSVVAVAPEAMTPETASAAAQTIQTPSDPGHRDAGHDHQGEALVHAAGCTSHASCAAFAIVAARGHGAEVSSIAGPDVDIQRMPPGRVSTPHAKPPIV